MVENEIVITKEMLKQGENLEVTKVINKTTYDPVFLNRKERIVDEKNPAEVLNWRTKNSKTFWLGGDKFQQRIKMHPVHYKGNDGTWNDLDPTIVDGVLTKSPYYARILPGKIGYVGEYSDGKKFELELTNTKYVEPIIEKNKVTNKNISKDTDFEITFAIGKIQANKILHSNKGQKISLNFERFKNKYI